MNSIKKLMSKRNISFTVLQQKTEISKSTLSPLVNSDEIPKRTKLETLERIATALGVSVLDLLRIEDSELDLRRWEISSVDSDQFETTIFFANKENTEKKFKGVFRIQTERTEIGRKEYFSVSFSIISGITDNDLSQIFTNAEFNTISKFLELALNRSGLVLNPNLVVGTHKKIPLQAVIPFYNRTYLVTERTAVFITKLNSYFIELIVGNKKELKDDLDL